jgi:hypothetical protein
VLPCLEPRQRAYLDLISKLKKKKNATGFKEPGGSTIGNFDSFLR